MNEVSRIEHRLHAVNPGQQPVTVILRYEADCDLAVTVYPQSIEVSAVIEAPE